MTLGDLAQCGGDPRDAGGDDDALEVGEAVTPQGEEPLKQHRELIRGAIRGGGDAPMVEQSGFGTTTNCGGTVEFVETDHGLGVACINCEQHVFSRVSVQTGSMSRPMSRTDALLVRPPIEMQSTPVAA